MLKNNKDDPIGERKVPQLLAHRLSQSQRSLLLTLVFLNAAGLHRLWDVRSCTGSDLGRLSGRSQPYSYRHTERFLSTLAAVHADDAFTTALARWTTTLWQAEERNEEASSPHFYLDGHRKAVYTDTLPSPRTYRMLGQNPR